MGPEVQVLAQTGLDPATDDTSTRNVGDFLGRVEPERHAQVPDALGAARTTSDA